MNPMQLMQMMKDGGNQRQMAMNMLRQAAGGNPILNNALNMAGNGNAQGLEQLARNLCKEKGINPEEAIKKIMGY